MGKRIHNDAVVQIEFKVDREYIVDVATVDEFFAITEIFAVIQELQASAGSEALDMMVLLGRLSAQFKLLRMLLCKLAWNDGAYLDPMEADPIIGKMSIRQMVETIRTIIGQISNASDGDAKTEGQAPVE